MENEKPTDQAGDSLESKATAPAQPAASPTDTGGQLEGIAPEQRPVATAVKKRGLFKRITDRVNIYMLLFILLIITAALIAVIIFLSNKSGKIATISTQTLSADTLKQLANSDAVVGDPKQVLSVQSNAIFSGNVLIRQAAEIAGDLTVGGSLKLAALNVSGNGTFDQVQANKLSISGDAGVQGQLAVQKSLSVSGSGTFSSAVTAPTVNTSSLQLTGDFSTTKHIVVSGNPVSKADGGALGSGGTSSVSGSDTAGTVTINTGSGTSIGCFMAVTFTTRFATTPKVIISPTTAGAGNTDYYVSRTPTGFSICAASPAPASSSLGFDYFVIG